jgi:hypothetical protein
MTFARLPVPTVHVCYFLLNLFSIDGQYKQIALLHPFLRISQNKSNYSHRGSPMKPLPSSPNVDSYLNSIPRGPTERKRKPLDSAKQTRIGCLRARTLSRCHPNHAVDSAALLQSCSITRQGSTVASNSYLGNY